ncbi:MAG: DUF1738 domain-containing protein [Bacteroidetes bacterium]|nr:MAG: DUF1738 domain-containing protein [Bacteroidota bacterium]
MNKKVEKTIDKLMQRIKEVDDQWTKEWKPVLQCNVKGRPYTGINQVVLTMAAALCNYTSPYWLTFNTIKKMGGKVRKGERGMHITFVRIIEEDESNDGRRHVILRGYTVFNACQADGLPEAFYMEQTRFSMDAIDGMLAQLGVTVKVGNKACYIPSQDVILMPPAHTFHSKAGYYKVLMHELVHWTGKRLDRNVGDQRAKAYAFEELVAEIGASLLAAAFDLDADVDNSAAYIKSWMRFLQDDAEAFVKASKKAAQAFDYIIKEGGLTIQYDDLHEHDNSEHEKAHL